MNPTSLQYPIGKFQPPATIDPHQIQDWIREIQDFPTKFQAMADSLTHGHLNSPYRPGGWTALQVIHHVPDSHMNAYLRFRWALTEDHPMIKAYDEASFAKMKDYELIPYEASMAFLQGIHGRWHELLSHMKATDWKRTYRHPEDGQTYQLDRVLGMYVWHGNHHYGHLKIVKEQR